MTEENKDITAESTPVAFWLEEKSVEDITLADEKTPLGDIIYNIKFGNGFGPDVKMAAKKYHVIRTLEKSDASSARERLVKKVGADVYALMLEYGLKFSEIDPVLNEVVRLINDGQNHAIDYLWGNEAYDRSLLDVNRVLLQKYESAKEATPEKGDDGVTPAGSTTDTAAEDKV